MAALPYIQLYVADYLADTMHLTAEEHGAYLLLIMNYWQTGKPLSDRKIGAISRVNNERLTDVKETLSEFFTIDDDGFWHHGRIDQELEKVKSKCVKASIAGKKSAESRAKSKRTLNGRSTVVSNPLQPKGNHTDTDTDTDNKKTSDDSNEVARHLENKILFNNPKAKINITTWSKDIDLAIRIDKRTRQELIDCINWIYSDAGTFWQANILSGKKLREKYDTMFAQANRPQQGNNQNLDEVSL